MSYLRAAHRARAPTRRYGPRTARAGAAAPTRRSTTSSTSSSSSGFPGYFLVVWDIVEFCRRADIFCQGRGSAANSAVCYALGITNADAVPLGLLFERFLSPERDGPPDIDIDIESDRREEVIQYVYERYGRDHAAQVANVITYRAKSAVRDMAKALGFAPGQQDAWSKQVDRWGPRRGHRPPASPTTTSPPTCSTWPREVEDFPRHLGIHSGGMVICDRPVIEVCPVEWGRMEDRTVLQWDKDDCAAVGPGEVRPARPGHALRAALRRRPHRASTTAYEVDLATIPQDDAVYDMLCRADSVGVFQVESRAQMATLPRLKPRTFYDLVVEVALIRPGPIQGGSVHPYIRRRNGQEPVTYLHPLLENVAGARPSACRCSRSSSCRWPSTWPASRPAEADQLRQAMGSKRSRERMERLRAAALRGHGRAGHHRRGRRRDLREAGGLRQLRLPREPLGVVRLPRLRLVVDQAALAGGVLRRRCSTPSPWASTRRTRWCRTPAATASWCAPPTSTPPTGGPTSNRASAPKGEWRCGSGCRRCGRSATTWPRRSPPDAVCRPGRPHVPALSLAHLEAMATAGVFGCFGLDRREALWSVGAVAQSRPGRLEGIVTGADAPTLPGMSDQEVAIADLWATGVAPHPTRFLRSG